MSCIEDLKEKFNAYENAMKTCLPKVDPKLITEVPSVDEKRSSANVYSGNILKYKFQR